VIVNNLNIFRVPISPNKADPKLVVHPDAMLPGSVTIQCFEHIARRRPQIFQAGGGVQVAEFPAPNPQQIRRKALWQPALPDCRRPSVPE
jgi:hypothetical protein